MRIRFLLPFICFMACLACKQGTKGEDANTSAQKGQNVSPNITKMAHHLLLAHADIEYFTFGNSTAKSAVALLPGGSLNVSYMDSLAITLAKKGYRVISINPRGAGNSTGETDNITMHDLANDVAEVLRNEQVVEVCVVGHAYGNRIARVMAADYPDMVTKAVLVAAGGEVPPTNEAAKALGVVFSDNVTPEQLVNSVKYMVGNPDDAPKASEIIKKSLAPKAGPIERKAAENTKLEDWVAPEGNTKFLIIQGSKDEVAPPQNGINLKEKLGDRATIASLKGAGHLMLVTRPEECSEKIISFLKE